MANDSPFALPNIASGSDHFKPAEHYDHLLILEPPFVLEKDVDTVHGSRDATRVDRIVDVTDGTRFADAFIFPVVLQSALTPGSDRPVLGRLGKGQAKGGHAAPWVLDNPTQADIDEARQFLESDSAGSGGSVAETPFVSQAATVDIEAVQHRHGLHL